MYVSRPNRKQDGNLPFGRSTRNDIIVSSQLRRSSLCAPTQRPPTKPLYDVLIIFLLSYVVVLIMFVASSSVASILPRVDLCSVITSSYSSRAALVSGYVCVYLHGWIEFSDEIKSYIAWLGRRVPMTRSWTVGLCEKGTGYFHRIFFFVYRRLEWTKLKL